MEVLRSILTDSHPCRTNPVEIDRRSSKLGGILEGPFARSHEADDSRLRNRQRLFEASGCDHPWKTVFKGEVQSS
jgi:hypothetical protein